MKSFGLINIILYLSTTQDNWEDIKLTIVGHRKFLEIEKKLNSNREAPWLKMTENLTMIEPKNDQEMLLHFDFDSTDISYTRDESFTNSSRKASREASLHSQSRLSPRLGSSPPRNKELTFINMNAQMKQVDEASAFVQIDSSFVQVWPTNLKWR
ncbi:4793_t:CDS:2 [Racocetra persica]|uniref:4793_t:CDS:1 n=1 Tax=Racocetra persica TaxID=160502 RepID=A0ACA9MQY7_9GLOM|nr:4793_t:CDS:2 [Racocetra persica]